MIRHLLYSVLLAVVALLLIVLAGADFWAAPKSPQANQRRVRSGLSSSENRLTILCAAGLAPLIEQLIFAFEEQTGVVVDATYQGSAELVSLFQVQRTGDLLLAADTAYHLPLMKAGLCQRPVIIGGQFPCLIAHAKLDQTVVPADLLNGNFRSSIPKQRHAAIGRAVAHVVGGETYQRYENASTVSRETVAQVAGDVDQRFADIGIAWNTTAKNFDNVQTVPVKRWEHAFSSIGVSVLATQKNQLATKEFITFVQSETATRITRSFGYRPENWMPSELQTEAIR